MGVLKFSSSSSQRNTCVNIKEYLEKDDRASLESTFNVIDEKNWDEEFQRTKEIYDKKDGRQYTHIIQSFDQESDNPNYTKENVHQAGKDLAEEYANQGYQIVVVTHTDTDNLHNHIIINSVNFETGKKIDISKDDIEELHKKNDEICEKHGLRTLDESKEIKTEREIEQGIQPTSRKTDEKWVAERGQSYKEKMRENLQDVFQNEKIKNDEEYRQALEEKGIKISRETGTGNITYQDESGHKARANRLGAFNRTDLEELYSRNREIERERKIKKQRQRERERGRSR